MHTGGAPPIWQIAIPGVNCQGIEKIVAQQHVAEDVRFNSILLLDNADQLTRADIKMIHTP